MEDKTLKVSRERAEILILALSDYGFRRRTTLTEEAMAELKRLEVDVSEILVSYTKGK